VATGAVVGATVGAQAERIMVATTIIVTTKRRVLGMVLFSP